MLDKVDTGGQIISSSIIIDIQKSDVDMNISRYMDCYLQC